MAEMVRMTLEDITAAGGGQIDHAKLAATTEETIRQHMIEDGEDPDASLPDYQPGPNVQAIRERAWNPSKSRKRNRPQKIPIRASHRATIRAQCRQRFAQRREDVERRISRWLSGLRDEKQ